MLFLDLDDFKGINDSLGHASGDELLASLAGRLRHSLRPADTIARLGGDEFAILLEDVDSVETARLVAERILDSLREPFLVAGKEVFVRTSIGIAPADQEAGVDSLMRDADVAMYVAKADGREGTRSSSPTCTMPSSDGSRSRRTFAGPSRGASSPSTTSRASLLNLSGSWGWRP